MTAAGDVVDVVDLMATCKDLQLTLRPDSDVHIAQASQTQRRLAVDGTNTQSLKPSGFTNPNQLVRQHRQLGSHQGHLCTCKGAGMSGHMWPGGASPVTTDCCMCLAATSTALSPQCRLIDAPARRRSQVHHNSSLLLLLTAAA